MKRSYEAESTDGATKRKSNNNASKKKKLQRQVSHDKEMSNTIECAMKEAKQILHRTQHPTNPHSHKAFVCIICDWFLIGTEKIHKHTSYQISQHSNRLSDKTYKTYHRETLKVELRKQYQVNGDKLKDLLVSPRSRKYHNGYATCACCYKGMCQKLRNKKYPPGFVIGLFPAIIQFITKDGKRKGRTIEINDLIDLLKAMLALVRPYGCVFAYSGGSQKSIKGNYQFFEMDQNKLGAVVSHLNQAGIGKHIYCVLCGRMTPDQKQIQLFIDILTWFVKESGHPGYQDTVIPEKCPQPLFVEDQETQNNTDESVNVNLETNI
jgi:hypothetical protein